MVVAYTIVWAGGRPGGCHNLWLSFDGTMHDSDSDNAWPRSRIDISVDKAAYL